MNAQKEVLVVTEKQSKFDIVKCLVAVSIVALSTQYASAAEISSIGAGVSAEIGGVKAIIIELFTLAAVLLGLFAAFKYLKKGANSA